MRGVNLASCLVYDLGLHCCFLYSRRAMGVVRVCMYCDSVHCVIGVLVEMNTYASKLIHFVVSVCLLADDC